MAQGVRLSEWQVQAIEDAWIMTGNASVGARVAGCNARTAQKHVRENLERLTALAAQKAPSHLETLQYILNRLLGGLADPAKIDQASLGDVAKATGIVIDKMQLLSGQATARVETGAIDPGRLTPEEMEQAARIRKKLAAEAMR